MQGLTLPKIKNILHMGMLLMIIKVSFSLSEILPYSESIDSVLSFASAGCFIAYILQKRWSIKTLIIYGMISLLALYSSTRANNYEIFITVLTCLAIRGEDIDKIFTFLFKYETLFFSLHTLYAVIRRVFLNESLKTVIMGVTRYHFGMGHPNRFSMYLFNLIILWVFLNFKRLKNSHIIAISLIGIVSYVFTRTRTNLLEMIIMIFLMFAWINVPAKKILKKVIKAISMYITPVLAAATMLCVKYYTRGNEVIDKIDIFLSSRIRLGAYAFQKYGLTLLGQPIKFNVKFEYDPTWRLSSFTFDNTYTFLCILQGIIWLVLLIMLFYVLSKHGSTRIHFAVIAWTLYGVTEVHGLNCYMCFPILLVVLLFDQRKYLNKELLKQR